MVDALRNFHVQLICRHLVLPGGSVKPGRGTAQDHLHSQFILVPFSCRIAVRTVRGQQGGLELDATELGAAIRDRRLAKKMSLAQVAERAGVSTSFVSQVERGVANPTLSSLKSLVEAVGSSVGTLLEGGAWSSENGFSEKGVAVLRAGKRRRIVYPGSTIANELLSPNLQRKMEIIWVEASPGASSGGHPHKHEGEECGIVISGEMKFVVGDDECVLGPRDAIYFPSHLPHSWECVGADDLIAIWIITPPTF
jgi:transcriptional regulator with XRE-family HTH domain